MIGNYWKVILRYGHLGKRRYVSIARYLCCDSAMAITDVFNLAINMPGVKVNGVEEISQINYETYIKGKEEEEENFYLKKLMTFNPIIPDVRNEGGVYSVNQTWKC